MLVPHCAHCEKRKIRTYQEKEYILLFVPGPYQKVCYLVIRKMIKDGFKSRQARKLKCHELELKSYIKKFVLLCHCKKIVTKV